MNFELNTSIEILERTPQVLKTLLWNLPAAWIHADEGEHTWNAFDVVGHLIHCEKADWVPRINIILSNATAKTFEPLDRFAQLRDSKGKTMEDLLTEFAQWRTKNIAHVSALNLSGKELMATGTHPDFGEVTLMQLLAAWVTHDLGHLAQISRVMAKHYTQDVGPWHAYISILKERT